MAHGAIALAALAATLALHGAAAQTRLAATQTNIDTNTLQTVAPPTGDPAPGNVTPGGIMPLQGDPRAPISARELRGNPLWAIPLKGLIATRERPIFLPSRRAPTPTVAGPQPVQVVVAPQPAAAPQRPRLVLVGAIVGDTEGIAVLLDEATREIVRLKTGESYSGWILRSVRGREVTLENERDSMVIGLPVPSAQQKNATSASDPL